MACEIQLEKSGEKVAGSTLEQTPPTVSWWKHTCIQLQLLVVLWLEVTLLFIATEAGSSYRKLLRQARDATCLISGTMKHSPPAAETKTLILLPAA